MNYDAHSIWTGFYFQFISIYFVQLANTQSIWTKEIVLPFDGIYHFAQDHDYKDAINCSRRKTAMSTATINRDAHIKMMLIKQTDYTSWVQIKYVGIVRLLSLVRIVN